MPLTSAHYNLDWCIVILILHCPWSFTGPYSSISLFQLPSRSLSVRLRVHLSGPWLYHPALLFRLTAKVDGKCILGDFRECKTLSRGLFSTVNASLANFNSSWRCFWCPQSSPSSRWSGSPTLTAQATTVSTARASRVASAAATTAPRLVPVPTASASAASVSLSLFLPVLLSDSPQWPAELRCVPTVQKSCGTTSALNNTYFVNPGYPGTYRGGARCSITINKCNPHVCQVS